MAFITLTRMVERRVKYGDRSDLHSMAYAPSAPFFVRADQIAGVSSMMQPVDRGEEQSETVPVTHLWLVGSAAPEAVAESVEEVMQLLGSSGRTAKPAKTARRAAKR